MTKYWETGETCIKRGIVNNKVWSAQSVIVIKDKPEETILLLLPGAQCFFPEGYWHWKLEKDYSHGTRWQEARKERIPLREFGWLKNRILVFLEPEKYYASFLFWEEMTNQFRCYYINFQLPYRRSQHGFDTLDLDLDIVVDPQYHWEWKDEAEYQEGIREGGIKTEWVNGIECAKPEVLERIHNRLYPLDGSWLHWKPDPTWVPPKLTGDWQIVE